MANSNLQQKRIGIDCRLGGLSHAGIGRYCEQLVYHLITDDENTTWVLFFSSLDQISESPFFQEISSKKNVETHITPIRHYTLAEQLILPFYFLKAKLDLLHVPHFNVPFWYPKAFVITIHDLLWNEYQGTSVTTLPKWIYWIKYVGYKIVSTIAIKRAKYIFVPTHTVRSQLNTSYPNTQEKVLVTYEGVNSDSLKASPSLANSTPPTIQDSSEIHANKEDSEQLKSSQRFAVWKPHSFLLYVGSLYPHKNITVVLKALQTEPTLTLAIAGSRSVFTQQTKEIITQLGIESQVSFLGYVPDSKLATLYQNALAVIQPSLSEGFGLTGIEAMSVGGIVIASKIPIFEELYPKHTFFFNPHDEHSLLHQIQLLKTLSPNDRARYASLNKKHASQFSWKTMARKTNKVYLKLLNNELCSP